MKNSISVIIPLYNHEKFIEATIKSVVNQTVVPTEIIVINDGSTDDSHTVMQRLCQEYHQIKYFLQTNQGAHSTINAAIAKAACKYIAILNSDDIYHPSRLELCLKYIISNPSVDMIVTAIQGIDEEERLIELVWCNYYKSRYEETNDLFLALVDGNFFFTTSNIFIKKSVFDEVGNFSCFRYAHDLDFFLRLITHNKKAVLINEPLLMYRIHRSNTISEDYRKVFLERDAIVAFHLYSRIANDNLIELKQKNQIAIITTLANSGRLETIFYYFCHYLKYHSQNADSYLWNKDFLDPCFYSTEESPPDSFLRFGKTVGSKQSSDPLTKPLDALENIPKTEFQQIGQIAVMKIGDKLKRYPFLAATCVKLIQSTWNLYRYFISGAMRKSIVNKYKRIFYIIDTPRFLSNSSSNNPLFQTPIEDNAPILFISHDAGRTGAPIVLLNLLRWIKKHTLLNFKIVLRGGGELSGEFNELGPILTLSNFSSALWKEKLHGFIGNSNLKLIYSNTAVNGDVIDTLKLIVDVPVISAIHELENSIRRFAPGRLFELVKKHTDLFIAVSNAVKNNLELNHAILGTKIKLVYPFIPVSEITLNASINPSHIHQELNTNKDMFIVGGSGTIDWRKGADLFSHIALIFLKMLTMEERCRVKFVWVGGDLNSQDMIHLNHDINHSELLNDRVIFIGEKKQACSYFSQFSVFLLSSREDPFPLVCLEAGALNKPVICFDKAGGIPDLVEDDGGFIVPYLDIDEAAHVLYRLFHEPELTSMMGKRISDKVHSQYDIEVGARQILSIINQSALLDNHASQI